MTDERNSARLEKMVDDCSKKPECVDPFLLRFKQNRKRERREERKKSQTRNDWLFITSCPNNVEG